MFNRFTLIDVDLQELDDSNFDNTKLATERDILKKKISQYETLSRR